MCSTINTYHQIFHLTVTVNIKRDKTRITMPILTVRHSLFLLLLCTLANTTRGLDGKAGPERCVSSGSNSPILPPVPTIPMAGEHISIQVPPIWPLSNTTCIHKVAKASSRSTSPNGNQVDHLPGRYTYSPSIQAGAGGSCGSDVAVRPSVLVTVKLDNNNNNNNMPIIQGLGPHDKQEEIPPVTSSKPGIFGLSSVLNNSEVCDSEGETSEDTAHRLLQQTTVSVRELARFIGNTTATWRALPAAPLHYRALQRLIN